MTADNVTFEDLDALAVALFDTIGNPDTITYTELRQILTKLFLLYGTHDIHCINPVLT